MTNKQIVMIMESFQKMEIKWLHERAKGGFGIITTAAYKCLY